MYRGRPPLRGGYRPPFEGRGLPPPRPYPAPGYRDDRNRPRPPFHTGYHDHGHPDSYRRSPPRRRYPSPGSGSHRGGEYWAGGPPRDRSPSPRGPGPIDHNLVITVGNELTGPSSSAPSGHHDRDYPPRPEYERSRSRGRSRPHSRSPDRSRAKSQGRSKSQVRSKSRPRSQSRSPDRNRAKSRGRSRPRSQSRSPDRNRTKSRGRSRSKSRSPDRSRAKSRGRSRPRSQSRSPDRNRAKSWGRGRSKSRSPDRSRAKSRGRSKSRPRSRSRSRSRSRYRSRSRSRSRSRGRSHGQSKSRQRSRSASSSSSSSSSGDDSEEKSRKEFKELEKARRRKELEEMLSLPTKSILKKRNDSEDSPSLRSSDSPRGPEGSNTSRVADQLLQAVRGMEPHMVASMLSELRSDPQMARRLGLDTEITEILHLLEGPAGAKVQEKVDDIDDEERFLYGDSEEPKPPPPSEPVQHQGLDLYGDLTEEALYGDYPPQKHAMAQAYGLPSGASPHLQAHPTMGEVDMRYASRPSISPDQNIMVQVANTSFQPETEPQEEYEKIQDLLKTIGLDLGVNEISKMAARTKERLHGNKPPPKTPTRSRRYSSGSSDGSRGRRRRSHSSSSSSSRSRSRGRGGSWSSDDGHRKSSAPPKSLKESNNEQIAAAPLPIKEPPSKTVTPHIIPPHPGVPIPPYPPSQVHSMMPPNFPPPGYSQYGNYLPYMHQQWPPMYPPPNMALPAQTGPDDFPPTLPYKHPYSKPSPEPGVKGLVKSFVQDGEKGKVSSQEKKVSEEQNNESQKQKVLEEREKLKQEREIRMKKKEYLMKELERLRKQQGELLRKKRREKGGHKDPLLQEISHLQEEVMVQISNLRKEHEAAEKKRNEIEKIALILGLIPSDRPRRTVKPAEDQEDEPPPPPEKKKREEERSPERRQEVCTSTIKTSAAAAASPSSRASPDKPPVEAPPPEPFEYYDAGNHWCKNCNVTSGSMFDYFTHLHSKTHRKTLDPYDRPWASTPTKINKNLQSEEKLTKPAKGSEFLLPVRGFFCLLCKQFYGDAICAEEHVTKHAHNEKYKKQIYENPLYEQRRNLDRQAGLTSDASGKKRKHEEEEKGNKEEKSKHKKEKKDKEKKKEEDDAVQKEDKIKEEAEEAKPSKKEDFKNAKRDEEEERPSSSKKEEDEKYKSSKRDDKYRYSREEEERVKYRRGDEDDRYKYSREEENRYRYRREEDDRYDNRPKYGPREDESKYGKYSDCRPKYDRERDEGKLKAEKEALKKVESGKPAAKPEINKPEPPPKPYDPPKILCGPSPAMRAKLRKQSLETGKTPPVAATPSFGKFTWKRKENVLAKEAEKVAAEFIKDDEAASKQNPVSVEDSFAKSMAVAKEIADKLGGQQTTPPWVPNRANRGRIRPNLPAPAAVLRKTAMMGKPAPLNTFLSIRPQNTGLLGPATQENLFSDGLTRALNAQNALLKTKPPYGAPGTAPAESKPAPFGPKLPPPSGGPGTAPAVSGPAPFGPKLPPPSGGPGTAPAVLGPAPFGPKLPPPSSAPGTTPSVSEPAPFGPKLPPPSSAPGTTPAVSGPAPFGPKLPPPSDAPGTGPTVSGPAPFGPKLPPPSGAPGTGPTVSGPAPFGPKLPPPSGAPGTGPMVSGPAPFGPKFPPPMSRPPPFVPKHPPPMSRPAPFGPKLPLPVPPVCNPAPPVCNPAPPVCNPAPPVSKPAPIEAKSRPSKTTPAPSVAKQAQPTMIKIVSDVAAPGVPEGEQTRTVFVKPPPFMNMADGAQKSEKLKSNLAAAKAQDIFDIFYSKVGQSGTSSITKPATDNRSDGSSTNKSQLPTMQAPKPQPQLLTQSESPSEVCKSLQPDTASPLTKTESDIQIASVWSLQTSPITTPEVAPSATQKTQPKLNPPAQTEAQSQNQSSTPKSDPQITPQTKPAQLEPTPQTQPKLAPQTQTEPQPDQGSHLETHTDSAPEPAPKPSPKTRGKATPTKRTPPAPRPVRQTRSQTRYQTRQQQQSQSEPELASGDSDSAASGLDTSDPGSGSQPGEGTPSEEAPQVTEITPETLGLPSDMTSLTFDYDFNFE